MYIEANDHVEWSIHIWGDEHQTRSARVICVEDEWLILRNETGNRTPFVKRHHEVTKVVHRHRLAA